MIRYRLLGLISIPFDFIFAPLIWLGFYRLGYRGKEIFQKWWVCTKAAFSLVAHG